MHYELAASRQVLEVNVLYSEYRQQFCIIIIKLPNRLDLIIPATKEMLIMWYDRSINYQYKGNRITLYKCIKSACCVS